MKFKILNGEPLQFYDSAANLMGTIQVSGSGGDLYIRPDSGSSRNVIIGSSDTVGDVQIGITSAPVNLKLLGGGTLTSNGNILYIGESATNDRVIISGATFTSSLQITGSLRVSGSAYAQYFVGDGSGLTNVAAAIAIKDEGVQLTPAVASIDFVGSGVSASVAGGNVTVTITSGGGGGSTDTGSLLTTASFSNPNLTFTEGDGTTFAINLSTLQPATASYSLTASYALNAGGTTINTASFVTTSSFNSFTASYATGSFTGSFNGLLTGTASYASYALTASYAMNGGGGAAFPYTGSATISGSLTVTGPITSTQTISGSRLYVSSSASNTITIIGSGSDLLTIDGTVGRLFAVSDDLSDSLFSVNTIAGLPVVEAFATNNVNLGKFGVYPIKINNSGSTAIISGSFTGSMVGNLTGTASYAAYALTASYALNGGGTTINTGSFVTTSSFNSFTASYGTGSFTGSFVGTLTGTASYSTTAATASYVLNAISSSYAATASYVLNAVSSSFATTAATASYVLNAVSASFATTSSYVLNAISASFASTASSVNPLNQSVFISASLTVTGSVNILQNITASRAIISGSTNTASGSILTVIGSGSGQPVFTVIGSSGELFSITDSLSGSLFSVNDISGLPILEVFSDSTTVVGDYQAPSLLTTKAATLNVGNTLIYSIPTASYAGAWFDYTITSASNARCGTVMAIRNGSSLVYTETTTTDIGSTAGVAFMVMITGSSMALTGSATSPSWSFKSIIRSI